MRIPKQYGSYQVAKCPFCGRQATTKNKQEVPTCNSHKEESLPDMKCSCGEYLDLRIGKYGPYFYCMNCGNINFKKGLEINPKIKSKQENLKNKDQTSVGPSEASVEHRSQSAKGLKEITITSDQVDTHYS